MSTQEPKHVFISYVRENQDQADRLAADLTKAGVNVWLDRTSIKPGARWKDAIREAIRQGDFFIACFSSEYASKTKSYVNEELTLAIEELRKYASDRAWFIPVLFSECDVPARSIGAGETLHDINWVSLFKDWDTGVKSILSVIKPISPETQKLITALGSENPNVRSNAISAMGKATDPLVIPILLEILQDQNEETIFRVSAASALGKVGAGEETIVPALVESLKDKDIKVRRTSAYALMNIGPKAKEAVPALVEALKDEDNKTRSTAKEALVKIGREAAPALIEVLKDEDKSVRILASRGLAEMGRDALPDLIKAPKSLRDWVVSILGNIRSPEAQEALEKFEKK